MSSFDLSGVLAGGGGILSGIGGILGGNSEERAARKLRDAQKFNTAYGSNRMDVGLYGVPYLSFQGKLADAVNQAVKNGDSSAYDALVNSPEYAQFLKSTGGPLIDQMRTASREGMKQGNQLVGDITGRLNAQAGNDARIEGMAAGQEGLAAMTGAGRANQIRREADRAQRETGRSLTAQAASRGLGNSSTLLSSIGAAQARIGESRDNSLNDLTDRILQARLGAGRDTLNAANFGAARMQDRTGLLSSLRLQNQANKDNLRMRPINAQLGNNQNIGSLWAGQQPLSGSSGTSGLGSALSGIGNTAAMLGAYGLSRGGFGGGGTNQDELFRLANAATGYGVGQ